MEAADDNYEEMRVQEKKRRRWLAGDNNGTKVRGREIKKEIYKWLIRTIKEI